LELSADGRADTSKRFAAGAETLAGAIGEGAVFAAWY
jgi:hypothetical protein